MGETFNEQCGLEYVEELDPAHVVRLSATGHRSSVGCELRIASAEKCADQVIESRELIVGAQLRREVAGLVAQLIEGVPPTERHDSVELVLKFGRCEGPRYAGACTGT